MNKRNETPLYATVFYHIRKQLDISWGEYIYLDMIYHLSKDGWCYKSLENVALDMGMAKSGVVKMRQRLIDKKLIRKSVKGYVKTTDTYHKVIRSEQNTYHKVNQPYHKVERSVPLSDTKNNNRITLDNREVFSKNKELIKQAIKSKDWTLLKAK